MLHYSMDCSAESSANLVFPAQQATAPGSFPLYLPILSTHHHQSLKVIAFSPRNTAKVFQDSAEAQVDRCSWMLSSFRMNAFVRWAVQGFCSNFLQHHISEASTRLGSAALCVHVSTLYRNVGKMRVRTGFIFVPLEMLRSLGYCGQCTFSHSYLSLNLFFREFMLVMSILESLKYIACLSLLIKYVDLGDGCVK